MKTLVISILLIILSISIYKLAKQDASLEEQPPPSPALVNRNVADQTISKDPFKEALENQAQPIGSHQDMSRFVKGTHANDPFKDFLEKQHKDSSQSKLSPFDSVSTK